MVLSTSTSSSLRSSFVIDTSAAIERHHDSSVTATAHRKSEGSVAECFEATLRLFERLQLFGDSIDASLSTTDRYR